MKKDKIKQEKGSITLYVVLSMAFFLFLILGIYFNTSNKIQKQEKEIEKIQQEYKRNNIEEVYEKAHTNYTKTETPTIQVYEGDTLKKEILGENRNSKSPAYILTKKATLILLSQNKNNTYAYSTEENGQKIKLDGNRLDIDMTTSEKTLYFYVINEQGSYSKYYTAVNLIVINVELDPDGGTYTMPTEGNATIKTTVKAEGASKIEVRWSEKEEYKEINNNEQVIKTDCTAGKYYLYVRINGQGTCKSQEFNVGENTLDSNKITITPNTTDWTNKDVTATVTYGSTLTENKKAGYGTTLELAKILAISSTSTSLTATENGYFYAEGTDKAGNKITTNLKIDKIDKTTPQITNISNPSNGNWTNGNVTVTLTGSDDYSGIKEFQWYKGGTWTTQYMTTNENTATITFADERNETIKFRVIDKAGNISEEKTTNIRIDKTPPTIQTSIKASQKIDFSNWTLTNGAYLDSSGKLILPQKGSAAYSPYMLANGQEWMIECDFRVTTVSPKGGTKGGTLVSSAYYDKNLNSANSQNGYAGNGYDCYAELNTDTHLSWNGYKGYGSNVEYVRFTISVDGSYSVAPVTLWNPKFTTKATNSNKSKIVMVNTSDNLSGVKKIKWLAGQKTESDFATAGTEFSDKFETTQNGKYTIYAEDNIGNKKVTTVTVTDIDLTKPTISLTPNTTSTANSVTLTGKSQDTESGIMAYAWTDTSAQPTKWTNITPTKDQITQTTTVTSNCTKYFWTKDSSQNINVASKTITNIVAKASITAYNNLTIEIGNTGTPTLTKTGTPKSTVYSSSNTRIATINSSTGEVKGVATGSATMTVTMTNYDGTTVTKTCTVTVVDTTKPTIRLAVNTTSTANSVTLTGTSQDTGSGLVAYAWTDTSAQPTKWTNITPTKDQITQTTTVTSNCTKYFWTKDSSQNINVASLTITNIVAKVSITAYNNLTIVAGNTGTPTLTKTGEAKSTVYSSSNTGIATINSTTGAVKGVAAGSATMTVKMTNYDGTTVTKTCTVTVQAAVAQVGSTYYASIANAISAISSSGTITLLANRTESPTFPAGKTITFNLNSKTLTGKIDNNGTLTISGGTITNTSTYGIKNNGTLTTSVNITMTADSAILNYKSLKITGGNITTSSSTANTITALENSSTTISSATIEKTGSEKAAIGCNPSATVTINSGTIKNSTGSTKNSHAIYVRGTLNVTGGQVINNTGFKDSEAIDVDSGGIVNISGTAKVSNQKGGTAIVVGDGDHGKGTLNVSGGTISTTSTDKKYATVKVHATNGTFKFTKGTIKNTNSSGYCYYENDTTYHKGTWTK